DFTISTMHVDQVLYGSDAVKAGTDIVVRQAGSPRAAPQTLLRTDGEYLLFLVASGLDGELASQFYVTGGNAGLYQADGTDQGGFAQMGPDGGGTLPARLTAGDGTR